MQRCAFFLAALIASPALAQPLAPEQDATTGLSPEMPPEQKLAQFRHDQINLLALRADAHPLLAAALMAQTDARDKSRPPALQSPALIKRAQNAGSDDALVWWATASIDCHGGPTSCPLPETLQMLEKTDAQNAAVWLLALWHAQKNKDDTTARAALTSAAQSAHYDDHFGPLMTALDEAADILPVSDDIIRASGQSNVTGEGYKLTYAAAIAATALLPSPVALVQACKDAASDSALAADCIAVAKLLANSASLLARNAGISQLAKLASDDATRADARARARLLAWQMQRIGDVSDRLSSDPHATRIYLGTLHDSGREIDAVQAVLRSQGIAAEPPADWQPPEPPAAPSPAKP